MQIPRRVLFNNDQVYVVEGGVLKTRQVNVEKISQDLVLISPLEANGLNAGDSLVVDLPANAIENMRVTTTVDQSSSKGKPRSQSADSESETSDTKTQPAT